MHSDTILTISVKLSININSETSSSKPTRHHLPIWPVAAPVNEGIMSTALCFKTRRFFYVISWSCYIEALQQFFIYVPENFCYRLGTKKFPSFFHIISCHCYIEADFFFPVPDNFWSRSGTKKFPSLFSCNFMEILNWGSTKSFHVPNNFWSRLGTKKFPYYVAIYRHW